MIEMGFDGIPDGDASSNVQLTYQMARHFNLHPIIDDMRVADDGRTYRRYAQQQKSITVDSRTAALLKATRNRRVKMKTVLPITI